MPLLEDEVLPLGDILLKDKTVDELEKLAEKPEVWAPADAPFEKPNKDFVAGPYYAAAEEVMTELSDDFSVIAAKKQQEEKASEKISTDGSRRDFMKLFSLGAVATASACVRRPTEKVIPYVNRPVDQIPGAFVEYATTCGACPTACGTLVKTREGRPTKIEGNPRHPLSQGALCARGQAQIQGLYHPERLKSPMKRVDSRFNSLSWDEALQSVAQDISEAKSIGILTGGASGSRKVFLQETLEKWGSSKENLFMWEANTLYSSIAKAHELAFNHYALPRIEFADADYIVGIGSDFQDVGTSSVFHSKGFRKSQGYKDGQKGTFVQFEANLTITGGKADQRHVIPAQYEWVCAINLVDALFKQGGTKANAAELSIIEKALAPHKSLIASSYEKLGVSEQVFLELAQNLLKNKSVVVAGGSSNFDENATVLQLWTILANLMIGSYGNALLLDKGWELAPVVSGELKRLSDKLSDIDVLIVLETNTLFAAPPSWQLKEKLEKVKKVISIQNFPNEMDYLAEYVLPSHHPMEAWGDDESIKGFWSIRQPVVRPTTGSRQAEDILLWISAHLKKPMGVKDYQAYLHKRWRALYDNLKPDVDFDTFIKAIVRRGFIGQSASAQVEPLKDVSVPLGQATLPEGGLRLITHLDYRLYDGRDAHLPVLQELPDAMTTITWDTWLGMNPNTMKRLGARRNQVFQVETEAGTLKLAVYPLPGLHPDVVVIPRGNGHEDQRSTISNKNGSNPLSLVPYKVDSLTQEPVTSGIAVKLSLTKEGYRLAAVQKQNDIANRKDIVKQHAVSEVPHLKSIDLDDVPDLFPALEKTEYRWGMAIDLDLCNGCGACVVACDLENNVPQVGREQIIMGREMHWLRLDRYFYGDIDKPTVTIQPIMCQHCNHAPCEAVCPVFATTHEPEGLNAMTYNRCVGTRYCANACPYKVRRFNWWTHKWGAMDARLQDRTPRALNPDVTVRVRGVMEKCSMCVGRLREAKHTARIQGRKLRDGEVKTACQQTCAMEAIVTGNLNDKSSRISQARANPRAYLLLGGEPAHGHYGLKTLPNVNYLSKVMHKKPTKEIEDGSHGHHS